MRFAYADPPYLGCGVKHYGDLHANAADYDHPLAHAELIDTLRSEYEGWALSASSTSLQVILPLCPKDARVMAWVKPFASFKPNVGVAYAWEPVIVCGGRKRTREQETVRDWVSANITMRRGMPGAKPAQFVYWLLEVLNAAPDDEIVDLFPGSGGVRLAIDDWRAARLATPSQWALV